MVEKEEVLEVAENARIDIDSDEAEQFTEDFEKILEMFSKLEKVDTEDVEPAFHPVDVEPETRDDEKEDCLSQEEVFRNTDNEKENSFKGPSV